MAIIFHPLTVKDIHRETADCVSVCFDVPKGLQADFSFKQGQYLTFKKDIYGEEVRRSYSICSSPLDGELRVAVKQVEAGIFSSYVNNELKVGDVLETMTPQGLFTSAMEAESAKNYFLVAAGSGITPILSIIKTVLQSEPKSNITLLYGNKNRGSIIFKSELEALKNKYMERLSIYHILSREQADADLMCGRIDAAKCQYFLEKIVNPQNISAAFLCGPEEMILSTKDTLIASGVAESDVHYELFFSALAAQKQQERKEQKTDSDTMSEVSIILDGTTTVISLGYKGESILDAALSNGADLPFACKGGVCATCRCKVESGTVEMDVNYSLEKDEIERGFILACQAHPRSEQVVVNFDAR
ncbi:MAG: phenylacetate-CoA oxygenase/reductase subunit PaaK [Phycisphaerales bacterium]|nr:phenylacetate-CoA oxygenase/reductase subunit PaaK [Phycisphaerales bacterium]